MTFNTDTLNITISGLAEDRYNFDWRAGFLNSNTIEVQLVFDNPSMIGLFE